MSLYEQLIEAMPTLTPADFEEPNGTIGLRNDSDGYGDYIERWDYPAPIPPGFHLGK